MTLELGGSAVAFSPDGATLAAVGRGNCCVRLYDVRTWQLRSTVTGHTDLIWELVFSPDGRTFATASWDSTVRLWSTSTGQLLARFAGEQGMYWSLSWSSDGRFLATVRAGSENELVVWEAAPREEAEEDPEGVHLWATALERQGKTDLAEQYLRAAWAAQRAKRGEQHPWSAAAMLDLGTLLTQRRDPKDYAEAEDLLLRARSVFFRTVLNVHEWRWRNFSALRSLYSPDGMNAPEKLAAVEAGLTKKAGPTTTATQDTAGAQASGVKAGPSQF